MLFLFCAQVEDAQPEMNRTNKSEVMVFLIIIFLGQVTFPAGGQADVISITQHLGTEPGAVATGSKQELKWVEQNLGLV
jgi:hypothetical protein